MTTRRESHEKAAESLEEARSDPGDDPHVRVNITTTNDRRLNNRKPAMEYCGQYIDPASASPRAAQVRAGNEENESENQPPED